MKTFLIIATIATLSFTNALRADDQKPAKPYPLTTCLVSNEELDSMGKPVAIVYEGQEIKFCCKQCVKKFKANPAKYMKALQAAEKK